MVIGQFASIDHLWDHVIRSLLDGGCAMPSRDGDTIEMMGSHLQLLDINANFLMSGGRDLSPIYAAGEMLWYLAGSNDGGQIMHYAPSYKRFLEQDGTAWGAYGERFDRYDQIDHIMAMLHEKPDSRQAVMTIYDPMDLIQAAAGSKKDIPCTLSLQFLVRNGELNLIVTMRSNDVWFGLPYDVFCFSTLQALLAEGLGLENGWYVHQAGSIHLYKKHISNAKQASVIGPCPVALKYERSLMDFKSSMAEAVAWERLLRCQYKRFDSAIVTELIETFGMGTRWTTLLGLAWMQTLPPLDTETQTQGFDLLMPNLLMRDGISARRGQRQ